MKVIALGLVFVATCASAQTVYKTVENGVPTFSDTPPEGGASESVDVETITLRVTEPSEDGLFEDRLAAMRETTDRMAEDRREREKHRAELKALNSHPDSDSEPVTTFSEPQPVLVGGYWPNYDYPNYSRPHRLPYRPIRPLPQPRPTIPNPPPGWSVMKGGNSQLMRTIVSGRRQLSEVTTRSIVQKAATLPIP